MSISPRLQAKLDAMAEQLRERAKREPREYLYYTKEAARLADVLAAAEDRLVAAEQSARSIGVAVARDLNARYRNTLEAFSSGVQH
jgi:hypothetical protein